MTLWLPARSTRVLLWAVTVTALAIMGAMSLRAAATIARSISQWGWHAPTHAVISVGMLAATGILLLWLGFVLGASGLHTLSQPAPTPGLWVRPELSRKRRPGVSPWGVRVAGVLLGISLSSGSAYAAVDPGFGPVHPNAAVTATPAPVPVPAPAQPQAHSQPRASEVVVRRGDTLWAIAARALGPSATAAQIAHEWPRWYRANQHIIGPNPDLILPGQMLRPPQ